MVPLVRDADLLDAHAILGGVGDPEEHPLLQMILRMPGADRVAEDRLGSGDAGAIRAAVEGEVPIVPERIDRHPALRHRRGQRRGEEREEKRGEERTEGREGRTRGEETAHQRLRMMEGPIGPGGD